MMERLKASGRGCTSQTAILTQDLRYGLRQIRRSPGFFTIAALLIALGIAATTQIFTLVNALLLQPLPVRDPQNLVQIFEQSAKRPPNPYFDYLFHQRITRYSCTLFETVGQKDTTRSLERSGHAERVHAVAVTEDFFSDLGVVPLMGRVLGRSDSHVAVLSYAYWSRSFGRDPKVLGEVVRLQGHAYTIIGVTREAFTGTTVESSPDLWMPFADQLDFSRTPNPGLDHYSTEIIARLRPGVSETRAKQEVAAFWSRYRQDAALSQQQDYKGLKEGKLEVQSIAHGISPIRDQSKTALVLLLAGTGLLMLMVCANVGGLLVSRAIARERETAVRVALGASRGRILLQSVIESLLLSVIGGCSGLIIAYASIPILMRWLPPARGIGVDPAEMRTLTLHFSIDFRVVAFSLAICILTAALCALAPAWRSSRMDINTALKSTTSDNQNRLFQSISCGFQVALCATLLMAAGLIIRTLSNLQTSNPGFNRDRVTIFSIDPQVVGYDSHKTWLLQQRLLSGVRNLPGVECGALAGRALMRGIGLGNSVIFAGQRGGGIINTSVNAVTPEYFSVMGIRFLAGRNFGPSDTTEEGKLSKVIVNEAFVRQFLNGRNSLGQKFGTGQQFVSPQYEIIGVVGDTKYRSLRETPPPIYYSYDFGPNAYPNTFILHVQSFGDPHTIVQPVRHFLRSIDPGVPLYQVGTLSEEIDRSLWQERLLAALTCCFGAYALLLSAIGLYGLLAYFVARRQREIGLRMALGAKAPDLIWFVVRRVIPILGVGVLAGMALSLLVGAWIRSLLYGVQPFDPMTNVAAISLLIIIGAGGGILPVLRAMRVDPSSTLRQE